MTDLRPDALQVHLTVDDPRTAQLAGATFARSLAGADPHDFAVVLDKQDELIPRAIVDADHSADQAELAAGHFGATPRATPAAIVLRDQT